MTPEFKEFPKMARLSRECVITEKIDGTNAQILIGEDGKILCGSRTRWITPGNDNYGFARWAHENIDSVRQLGPGIHFGEWWGSGIQRGYGLTKGEKRFSLFNTTRWCLSYQEPRVISTDPKTGVEKRQDRLPDHDQILIVPELWRGNFDEAPVDDMLELLQRHGSIAASGFRNPEGIVIYHTAAGVGFKKTIEKDELPKSLSGL